MYSVPASEGHYWAKWKIASPETPPDMRGTGDEWEVVQVWDNNSKQEPFRVSVPGVEQSQELDAFYWGPKVEPPQSSN